MSYVLAILGLAGACALWYVVQRWSGRLDQPPCGEQDPDCDTCEIRDLDRSLRCVPGPSTSERG